MKVLLMLVVILTGYAPNMAYPASTTIDPLLIEAIIQVESGGNPNAVSKVGAIGLMQIMPRTGRMLGYSRQALRNPELNVEAGTKYLSQLIAEYGEVRPSLRAYHCGYRNNRKVCYRYQRKVLKVYDVLIISNSRRTKVHSKTIRTEEVRQGYSFPL